MFDSIGVPEILLILIIIFIFFGAGKLPEVASSLGKAVKNFKKAQLGNFDNEIKNESMGMSGVSTGEVPKVKEIKRSTRSTRQKA
jgi:sec-independent protein translocase protein TatA